MCDPSTGASPAARHRAAAPAPECRSHCPVYCGPPSCHPAARPVVAWSVSPRWPGRERAGLKPIPSSETSSSTPRGVPTARRSLTRARRASACLTTLVSASWAVRYNCSSRSGARESQCSGVSTSMTRSALAATAWACLRMAAGSPSSRSASGRSSKISARISAKAFSVSSRSLARRRPRSSTDRSVPSLSRASWAAPVSRVIENRAWETESCSSRARRCRASIASRSCASANRRAFSMATPACAARVTTARSSSRVNSGASRFSVR